MDLKERIERVLSEILSEKYDCNVTFKLKERNGIENEDQHLSEKSARTA